jgi:hypothetical protein
MEGMMTYQIKNTVSGKIIRDAITTKPLNFESVEIAAEFKRNFAANLRIDCKRPFRLVVIRAA